MITSCSVFLEQFAQSGILATAYYSHLIPVFLALLLSTYALFKTKGSKLAVLFFLFTFSFSLWLVGDLVTWTTPAYAPIIYVWSWLDLVNIIFFIFGAYFFTALALEKVSIWRKVAYGILLLPALVITITGNSILEFYEPVCEATNSSSLTNYKLFAEVAAVVLMMSALMSAWGASAVRKRIQLVVIFLAIVLFFTVFAGTEYVASISGIYEINLYGLFVLPLFLVILTFAITDLRLFQLRFVGTQILAYTLIVMVGSQLIFIESVTTRNLALLTLAISLLMGVLLIENAKREAEARLRIEQLAKDLQTANDQQVTLIHFITHQIKGFVTKSRNIFSMMQEGDFGVMPDPMKDIVRQGFESDTKGVATIQEILNAANIKSGKVAYSMNALDIRDLITTIAKDLKQAADAKGLALNVELGTEPVSVNGDAAQLVNAFKNLIDNSIKYTPKGSVTLALEKKPGKAVFTISDTGIGITPEDMKNLFTEGGHGKESQKVNVESTGFGLYIVKNIIEAHKGRVWAESEGAGKGSKFIVELPA